VDLNQRAFALCETLMKQAVSLRVQHTTPHAQVIDFGIEQPGGLEAGRRLAEICLAGLGQVTFVPGRRELGATTAVAVSTDHPVAACMASQYAGWQLASDRFFAMGSGPMRAAAGSEEIFQDIGFNETPEMVVGVLECGQIPPAEIAEKIATACKVSLANVTLCVAPTASQAGSVQVVARSVETALHKMHELGFDISRVQSGYGIAPLAPVAKDDLAGIGRTNDAVLYGGEVTLWVRGDDESLQELGPQIPSCSSADHGRPFAEIFEHYNRDFYKIDPLLFSPAEVTLNNLDTGSVFHFGRVEPEIVKKSFGM
jgi:methenyltetrahydromethanopterin cyclohydrolase